MVGRIPCIARKAGDPIARFVQAVIPDDCIVVFDTMYARIPCGATTIKDLKEYLGLERGFLVPGSAWFAYIDESLFPQPTSDVIL